jgi:hypothetical protein
MAGQLPYIRQERAFMQDVAVQGISPLLRGNNNNAILRMGAAFMFKSIIECRLQSSNFNSYHLA